MANENKQLHSLIDGIHEALLGRPVDPPSLNHWSDVLGHDLGRIVELMPLLLGSDEFSAKLGWLVYRFFKPEVRPFTIEHSQYREIGKLLALVLASQIKHPIVVDVGANGIEGSNSYDLMRHFSWRGLLIEANPRIIARIDEAFTGLNYTLINTAVSNYTGSTKLFLGISDGISSIQEHGTSQWGEIKEAIEVPVQRLPDILEKHGVPKDFGLLSIDAEGEDLNILNDTIDSGYRPQWIIFEAYLPQQLTSLDGLPLSAAVRENYVMAGATYSNLFLRAG